MRDDLSMKQLVLPAALGLFVVLAAQSLATGCGSDDTEVSITSESDASVDGSANGDGSATTDGPITDPDALACRATNQACAADIECCSGNCFALADGGPKTCGAKTGCKAAGGACVAGTECCTGACVNNQCSAAQCTADNAACTVAGQCCSGACTNNVCAPLSTSCKTSGNPCANSTECCSGLCNGSLCSAGISFCVQAGDACASNSDCCGGNCNKPAGVTLGVCGAAVSAPGATNCAVKGTVCGTIAAGGTVPPCGGECCSRSCAPTGAAPGYLVCQPPSGCAPTGEICRNDSDCCGWSGAPQPLDGPVTCAKSSSTQEFGRCDNGGSCREPGSICKPSGESCNAENNCCEHATLPSSFCNSNPNNCCGKDALGIPRCLIKPVDCTANPPPAGAACATSADCCGKPCVNNICLGTCVPSGGSCTTTADCCAGIPCAIAVGQSKGTCTPVQPPPDAGPGGQCALYGQSCATLACCDNVPCTAGLCRYN